MAAASRMLTVQEFESLLGGEKPYYEFWYGEAVQKSTPTWIHGLLQRLFMDLLSDAGYKAGSEVKLKIDPAFHPVPDVIATRGPIEQPYPTNAVEIVVEILSEDDSMSRILSKCRSYQEWGFAQIYVIDPQGRLVFRWIEHRLEEVAVIAGQAVSAVWAEFDRQVQ